MASGTSIQSTESSSRDNSRRRPLHTCGVLILTMAHKVYMKSNGLNGPIGSLTRKLATFVGPIVYAMQCQWLAILSFIDNQILTIESVIEILFPSSSYMFNKIDALVHILETLPEKFNNTGDKSALTQLTSVLNFLITIFINRECDGAKEKEITIDVNSHDNANEFTLEDEPRGPTKPIDVENEVNVRSNSIKMSNPMDDDEVKVVKSTYKEVLEMGVKEEDKIYKEEEEMEKKKGHTYKEVLEMGSKKEDTKKMEDCLEDIDKAIVCEGACEVTKEDPILELFAAGWHMKQGS